MGNTGRQQTSVRNILALLCLFCGLLTRAQNNLEALQDTTMLLRGGEQKLITNITEQLFIGNADLLRDFTTAQSQLQIDELFQELDLGSDFEKQQILLERIEKSQLNYLRFISRLSKKVKNDPEALLRVEKNLSELKSSFRARGISWPSGYRCATGVLAYTSVTDWTLSFWNSFLKNDLPAPEGMSQGLADYYRQSSTDNWKKVTLQFRMISGALMAALCSADLIYAPGDLKRAAAQIRQRFKARQVAGELHQSIQAYREESKFIEDFNRLRYVRGADRATAKHIVSESMKKYVESETMPDSLRSFEEKWSEFVFNGELNEVLQNHASNNLSPQEQMDFQKLLRGETVDEASRKKATALLEETHNQITAKFWKWFEANSEPEHYQRMLDALERYKSSQTSSIHDATRARASKKACLGSIGVTFAAAGVIAAVGNDEIPPEASLDGVYRKNGNKYLNGATTLMMGTCGFSILTGVHHNAVHSTGAFGGQSPRIHNKKIAHIEMTDDDWKQVRVSMDTGYELATNPAAKTNDATRMLKDTPWPFADVKQGIPFREFSGSPETQSLRPQEMVEKAVQQVRIPRVRHYRDLGAIYPIEALGIKEASKALTAPCQMMWATVVF